MSSENSGKDHRKEGCCMSAEKHSGARVPNVTAPLRVAIAGLGLIGQSVADMLDAGVPGIELAAIGVRDVDKARRALAKLRRVPLLFSIDELEPHADLVVECAPADLLPRVVGPFVRAGKKALVLSCGALLRHEDLIGLAAQNGG